MVSNNKCKLIFNVWIIFNKKDNFDGLIDFLRFQFQDWFLYEIQKSYDGI